MFGDLARVQLANLPTPLERGPQIAGGVRLWLKRDDSTGLGLGGNKVRKLEFLCGEARELGARSLVTVGAGQSNHCRLTAAAGARLGFEVHLVLAGERPATPAGNQLLSALFGAQMHFTGAAESHWGELEIAREALTAQLADDGMAPYSIPIGGSTARGALGYMAGFAETMTQCDELGLRPAAIVHASSSGGTHAGLLAGRALAAACGDPVPEILAIGVAAGVNAGRPDVGELAQGALSLIGSDPGLIDPADVHLDPRWIGDDYAEPTTAADAAIMWAARRAGWVFDRVYTGKALAGVAGNAADGRWAPGSDVILIHTGGHPSVFAPSGIPPGGGLTGSSVAG